MLTIGDPRAQLGRRSFLKVGGLSLGGLSLAHLLAGEAFGSGGETLVKDKSVIFCFLHGGPPQHETFDPKMSAPSNIRSTTGEIQTAIPGITFGSTMRKCASYADRLAIVRSYRAGDADHNIKPIVTKDAAGASLGAVYSRVAGINSAKTGLPTNVCLYPRAVEAETQAAQLGFGNFAATGPLGAAYAGFSPDGGGDLQKDMQMALATDRMFERRALVSELDRLRRSVDQGTTFEGLDKLRQQAFDTIVGGVAEAFDLKKEDPAVIARYDTDPLLRPENISKKWNNYKNYCDNAKTLGRLLLLARRLCERGAGFVTVTTNFVWDFHSDVNNAGAEEGIGYCGVPLDHALGAYIEDVTARGLDKKILLVVCGEIGRTPTINDRGGRDHWAGSAPLLLFGGGLKMGQVIGQSDRTGAEPASRPYSIKELVGTIMHTVFDVGKLRVTRGMPQDIVRMTEWGTIPELLG